MPLHYHPSKTDKNLPVKTMYRVALAGNPNTGKSTLFNALTGLRQHTGNWPGKTVLHAEGTYDFNGKTFKLIDLPGTYSLYSNSADEEVARDCIVFEQPDVTVVVLDATAMERNMNLALQVLEITDQVILCVNLMDEARKKGIWIDTRKLSAKLGVPVIPTTARNHDGLQRLQRTIEEMVEGKIPTHPYRVHYGEEIEKRIAEMEPDIRAIFDAQLPSRWIALRLLDGDQNLVDALKNRLNRDGEEKGSHGTDQPLYPIEA
ncbi:FeoB small GTPase domain-containing protein [Salinithrix halophila]|uniref:FeoB small GTPase domain-containing protein n=1 Tax=Salinithrix halophila TaxID=1485204 RepID=A0ABV8JNJ6_9BACL